MGKNLETIRHSFAHVLAAAVYQMFPEAKFGIGPTIENGFYYDFELPRTLIPEDLEIIEGKMKDIIKSDVKFEKKEVEVSEAKKFFEEAKQPYKIELIEDLKAEEKKKVTIYKSGDFVDLCSGPHVESTKDLNPKAFKLTSIAGAYWRGNENNAMLQRIYGVAFEKEEDLKKFLAQEEEAKKRDHRVIGKAMDLFSFHEEAPGMPFWHGNGVIIFDTLVDRWRKIQESHGYLEIRLPDLLDQGLWVKSGHYDHYKDGMFFTGEKENKLALRPMDCPGAILYYQEKLHSYHEMPIRLSELGTVYRKEQSGELHGLMRVQHITQDDAHIFISEEMIEDEVIEVLKIMDEIYKPFDMKHEIFLSTKPDNAMGDIKTWQKAENALKSALKQNKTNYSIKEKDGAFYGPKIDIHLKDSLGRTWQTGTIQLDFFMPERFKLKYIDQNGKEKTPVMIHRALMGSLERFIGILIEHYGGLFPLWLAPEQVRILPISDKFNDYAQKALEELVAADIRAKIDDSNESLGKKIRNAELEKVPYMFIVGEKEKKAGTVSVRHHSKGDLGTKKLEEILKILVGEIKEKKIN